MKLSDFDPWLRAGNSFGAVVASVVGMWNILVCHEPNYQRGTAYMACAIFWYMISRPDPKEIK